MIALDKLVEVGFTLSQATNISLLFRNVGYLTVGETCVKTGVTIPANKILIIDSNDTLNATLKPDSQEYMDISNIQKLSMNLEMEKVILLLDNNLDSLLLLHYLLSSLLLL